jgi:hypothetical protein
MEEINFDEAIEELAKFEKKAGFDKTSEAQLLEWINEEVDNYKGAKGSLVRRNKLMDIICLVMQIAKRNNMSLDAAWTRWWKKSEKYLRKKK